VARAYQGRRRNSHPVPPCHRYCADDPGSHRHQSAGDGQRHYPKTYRRCEHGLHVCRCQGAFHADDAVFRDGWQPRDLQRRMDGQHHPVRSALGLGHSKLPDVVNGYKWELYHITKDFTQNNDLADKNPDKLKEMQALFLTEAAKYNVLPLDNTAFVRLQTPRPSAVAGKTEFTYTGENAGIPLGNAPDVLDKDFTITAEITVPKGGAEGMIVTLGGRFGGYGFFLQTGKPVFVYNLPDLERFRWEGGIGGKIGEDFFGRALPPGKHSLVFDFKYDGPGPGKSGTGVLTVDGKELAKKQLEHTIQLMMTIDETFDVG